MDWHNDDEATEASRACLTFEVGDAIFAVDVASVSEILDLIATTPIPGAPEMVRGMINVRDRSIVTMDGPGVFSVPAQTTKEQNDRMIVFELATQADDEEAPSLLAVQVDKVRAVDTFRETEIGPAPDMAGPHVTASAKRNGETILFVRLEESLTRLKARGAHGEAAFSTARRHIAVAE